MSESISQLVHKYFNWTDMRAIKIFTSWCTWTGSWEVIFYQWRSTIYEDNFLGFGFWIMHRQPFKICLSKCIVWLNHNIIWKTGHQTMTWPSFQGHNEPLFGVLFYDDTSWRGVTCANTISWYKFVAKCLAYRLLLEAHISFTPIYPLQLYLQNDCHSGLFLW